MAIGDKNKEYTKFSRRWSVSRANIGGQDVIKGETGDYNPTEFLPQFVPANADRYKVYVERAIFTAFTSWTHSGLLGSVFRKKLLFDPVDTVEYLKTNADGKGHGIEQLSKRVVSEGLEVGRLGLFTEYPVIEEGQKRTGEEQATILLYKTENIIDWDTTTKLGKEMLTQVVLLEHIEVRKDRFTKEPQTQHRVLTIDEDGYYFQEIFNEEGESQGQYYPRKYNGDRFDIIPFQFIGSADNTPTVDKPPLLDIAWLNLGHYHNSADHEENIHIHGQGTLLLWSDLSVDDFKTANPDGINVGAKTGHFLGSNGGGDILQLGEAQILQTAMDKKVEAMIGIGARFITDDTGNQVVAHVAMNRAQKESGLSTLVGNCEDGIIKAIGWVMDFMTPQENEVEFELNRNFFDDNLTPEQAASGILLRDAGIIGKSDIRRKLRKADWIDPERTDEDIDNEIEVGGFSTE